MGRRLLPRIFNRTPPPDPPTTSATTTFRSTPAGAAAVTTSPFAALHRLPGCRLDLQHVIPPHHQERKEIPALFSYGCLVLLSFGSKSVQV
uniref:Uncharacterized protein n=1 Tax=Oryza meridionalis TaxID=40149 RepID=A0A0E0D2M8_9ORYZ